MQVTSLKVLGWMNSDSELDTPVTGFSFLCPFYACIQLATFVVFYMFGTDITHLYGVSCGTLPLFEMLPLETSFLLLLHTTFV